MRRLVLGGSAVLLGVVGLVEFAGCNASFDICEGSACTAGDGAAGDGQVLPQGCDPTKDPKDSPACVDDTIGIFVSASGSDSNAGTKSSPLKTIGAAVGKTDSQHNRVYVCDGTYAETVKLTGPSSIYGGFACADWSYAGTLPKVGPATSGYALDVESVSDAVIVEDLELDAPSGQAPGESSIAVFVTQSTNVLLRRVTAKSGDGAAGADAIATSNYDVDAGSAPAGNTVDAGDIGASPCVNACGDGTRAVGGAGGNGGAGGGANGADGGPNIPPSGAGVDGMGGIYGSPVAGTCSNGHPGAAALNADGGASGAAKPGIVASTGWTIVAGDVGVSAGPGQGGGGGSGGMSVSSKGGGGSGGCGGCGGGGGAGGGSGGSSFAVLVFQSTLTVDACTLQTGAGGTAKPGGTGQIGQSGGVYGDHVPSGSGCQGGQGGAGGAGAGGGGGAGGNAIAIGYLGTKPTVTGGSMQEGNAGAHGAGGNGAASNNGLPGADGIKADVQELQ